VFTLDRAAPRILEHRYLASARWDSTAWAAPQGWMRDFRGKDPGAAFRKSQEPERLTLDPPDSFAKRERSLAGGSGLADQSSVGEVADQIENLKASGYDPTRLRVEYYAKMARPLTPLVMVLLGLPFAFRVGRAGSMYAIGVSLVLVIVYWAVLAIFNALGLETMIPAALAAFAPNILFGVLGGYLLLLVRS
jgi:lipopolysaccharide export LptBFGC system permease protein LptF